MNLLAKVGWTALTLLLGAALLGATSSFALAEGRGNSGLPSGPGNPMAKLQQEINMLTQRLAELAQLGQSVAGLQQKIDALQKQMTAVQQQTAAYAGLQQQVNTLNGQVNTLQQQTAAYAGLQQQINALNSQVATLQQQAAASAGLQQQVGTLNGQVANLNTQLATVNSRLGSLGSSNALAVYDAHDNKIGEVVGVQDNIPWVSLTAGGQVISLRVFSGQLLGGFVWFSGARCAGTAYISDTPIFNGADVFAFAAVQEPGGVIYVADIKTPVQSVRLQSVVQQDGTCFTFSSPVTNNVVPATPVMTLDLQFTRPYSVH
jgi:uncharacterized protein YoxC